VSFDAHVLAAGQPRLPSDVEIRNVVAILPGRSASGRRIYIGAHNDTLAYAAGENALTAGTRPPGSPAPEADVPAAAPGANDNGSGTALMMELARAFAESGIEFDATLVFAAWAGEEQGLYGSTAHAQALAAAGTPVEAVFNSDIVGNSRGGNGVVDAESVRVYSEGPEDSTSRALARYVERTAAIYVPSHRVRLMARADRFNRGSDHTPFSVRGFPAITFREANEDFVRQHSGADTIDGVDFRYLLQNGRVKAAAVASLALAPPAPAVTDEKGNRMLQRQPSGYDATLLWTPVAGATAYRIYWRDTWTNVWQHMQQVGNVTTFTLPDVSIDDFVFGVSAVGADGHESLVQAYTVPPSSKRDVEIK
jgi:Zn-dependent M28 family amino/carboxypeptidase